MKLISASSFYRLPFDERAHIEDGSFLNARAKLFGVADGVSEAYSPSNPPLMYEDLYDSRFHKKGITSGQMIASLFAGNGASLLPTYDAEEFLLGINNRILATHRQMRKDPIKGDDVGGASFCVCKICDKFITLIFGGDCFALVKTEEGYQFFSGFDEAAFKVEKEDNEAYTRYLQKAEGNRGLAWDLYWPEYRAKRLRISNKNLGKGGSATLNGDPALKECWSVRQISLSLNPRFVLLGTDGLLPSHKTDPANKGLAEELGHLYSLSGLSGVLKWRDETEQSLAHLTGWPEASAIEIKFS